MEPIIATMISQASKALENSYAPYSKFNVACCIRTDKDNLYTGINIENGSYGLTLCAEASALAAMVSAGERRIKSLVVLAGTNQLCSPCGACRQRIFEFANPETMIHLCNNNSLLHSISMDALLPLAFDFDLNN